ncbi:cathepsin L1-like [Drosophila innubila]|uniref:cathepsin L1-like n=1 Tax=Drosophila innubila TaxID=198719 RepID=UPI00148D00D1|nr:cathepsin L1-like [Drosophila innubila]
MKLAIAVLFLVGFAQAHINYQDVLEKEFDSFKQLYNKIYKDVKEHEQRKQIFKDNKELINKHNKGHAAGEKSYKMGVNQFTDLHSNEFKELMLSTFNPNDLINGIGYIHTSSASVKNPESIDWRDSGAVTGVKDQGPCGSCWAFSAVGSLEGQHFIKNQQLVSLSEQNLVDCSKKDGGCQGGWPANALQYIKDNGGVDTEDSYPYEAKDGDCRFNGEHIGATVSDIAGVASGDESALATAVAEKGPISVAIDASLFQHYQGGVFDEPSCQGGVNHGVVVVGYGHDDQGGDYWQVKNSWGQSWGENGYIRMARNKNNQCKIASFGVFPVV